MAGGYERVYLDCIYLSKARRLFFTFLVAARSSRTTERVYSVYYAPNRASIVTAVDFRERESERRAKMSRNLVCA